MTPTRSKDIETTIFKATEMLAGELCTVTTNDLPDHRIGVQINVVHIADARQKQNKTKQNENNKMHNNKKD